jgi:hypothetical protein
MVSAGALVTVVVLTRHLKFHFVFSATEKQAVLGTTNRPLSLIRHGPHRKRRAKQFCVCVFVSAVKFLPSRCLATIVEFLPS